MTAKRLIQTGTVMLIAGFIVLFFVKRTAANFAGFISPALMTTGWIAIAVGLWKKDEQ
ncbi:MAG: hypothetical protein U9R36_07125 [Elusimicrobiota bacterium]|nr:hypothetical protein [Elusimicrobiota bacterium]